MASKAEVTRGVLQAWGRILAGRRPNLSIEITRECPLRCPGCYAYGDAHLGGDVTLRRLPDYRGDELVDRVMRLIDARKPLHVSIVGGEPLVRYRELERILPMLAARNIHTQLVTSAVRPIPTGWARLRRLQIVVSVDGLPAEHDQRRAPATYDRILKHIAGHQITVHCTITRPQLRRPGYLCDFANFWSRRQEVRSIWFSLFTPQEGEQSEERLEARDREVAVAELARLREKFPKVNMPSAVLDGYSNPPVSPDACIFAQTTTCISANLTTRISPCQFGGKPVCSECGCMASAGLASIGNHKLAGLVRVSSIFDVSRKLGEQLAAWVS